MIRSPILSAVFLAGLVASLAAIGCAASGESGRSREIRADYTPVMEVTDVAVKGLPGDVPKLQIRALGNARTAGWLAPRLVPANPAASAGVYRFNFVASRPEGMAAQMITPIEATYTLEPVPNDLKAVMVIAETNNKTVNLP